MANISTPSNPPPCEVSDDNSGWTSIQTGYSAGSITIYNIMRQDGQTIKNSTRIVQQNIRIASNEDVSNMDDIKSITGRTLVIRLQPGSKLRVQVSNQPSLASTWSQWSAWQNFETPQRSYSNTNSDAITRETVISVTPVTQKQNATLQITNNAPANEVTSSTGSTVRVSSSPVGDVAGNPSITTRYNTNINVFGRTRGNRSRPGAVIRTRCSVPAQTGSRGRRSRYYTNHPLG